MSKKKITFTMDLTNHSVVCAHKKLNLKQMVFTQLCFSMVKLFQMFAEKVCLQERK